MCIRDRYQTNLVLNKLKELFPDNTFKLKKIVTKGDKFLTEPLESSIEKGFFVKEIQESLIKGEIDIAVHSLKDLPVDTNPHLFHAAILKRGDHRDSFLSSNNIPFDKLKPAIWPFPILNILSPYRVLNKLVFPAPLAPIKPTFLSR